MRSRIIEEDLRTIVNAPLPWDKFSGMSVLITGATGFIAAYIAETLLFLNEQISRKPARVICLVRNKKKALQRFSHYKNRQDIIFLVQDVCDPIHYREKVDYIIHAASHATPSRYGTDPVGTILPNILGTYRLLEFAKLRKVRGFLFISSGEVYSGLTKHLTAIAETDLGSPNQLSVRSCYAESKRMGETMCISWFHQYRVPTKIARLFHTYGPGMTLGDGRVHSDFVKNVVENKNIVMKSDGRVIRTFSYVADSVSGFFTVLLKGKPGEAYNLGSDKMISVRKFAETVAGLYPEKKMKILTDSRDQENTYLKTKNTKLSPDISKIKRLGWKPVISLKSGLLRTVESCKP